MSVQFRQTCDKVVGNFFEVGNRAPDDDGNQRFFVGEMIIYRSNIHAGVVGDLLNGNFPVGF